VSGTADGSNSSLRHVQWASRVNPKLIRRLYQTDALGIGDEELIDAVGYALLARCQSMLQATAAHAGRVICPECGTLVLRESKAWDPMATFDCPQCTWHVPWVDYFKAFQGAPGCAICGMC
jgi:predicted RNA-binding Zn-ribbon protein involved in translation (DUF1610 family)